MKSAVWILDILMEYHERSVLKVSLMEYHEDFVGYLHTRDDVGIGTVVDL